MDELEELDEIKEGTNNDHTDETSTETPIGECEFFFFRSEGIIDSIEHACVVVWIS